MNNVIWQEAMVVSIQEIASGIRRIELSPLEGVTHYDPGSHIDVQVQVNDARETRSYSLIGESGGDAYVIAVRLASDGRGGSIAMHALEAGQTVRISKPKNLFSLSYTSKSYLLVAGGIGVTPLVSMASALARRGADVRMVYMGRDRSMMALIPELTAVLGDRLTVHADSESGPLDMNALVQTVEGDGEAYVCGPIGMLESVRSLWASSGRVPHRLRFETFGSNGHRPPQSFVVDIPRLGKQIVVPADRSMLEALEEAGAEPLFNCRRGECGLCSVQILSVDGEVDHRDVFFSDRQKAESSHMCSCVSRIASGRISIELP